ncbi:hypothetical protein CH373_03095 [Leptospira perolatii]|uniref:Lipoprotein n=1 Tax=Leptospira perolatii TaxID=2023191 RepID=A0A2M9ZSZ2_9LEPT|nr:hypothetical protein [Leptospira perolatii]PJZ71489.1 hypothetical protein CH360_03090 [Leptospira perolatii]PJZ75023.1 hypothetical protein CH373_03095 [Leptospira perolatii]
MLSLSKTLALFSCLILTLNCHTTVVVHKESGTPDSVSKEQTFSPDRTFRQGSYLVGIYPSESAPDISCPSGTPEVKMITSFRDALMHVLIGGVYTTKTVEVYCKK